MDNFQYNVAVSFAGEDRKWASKLAELLQSRNISVFYDDFEKADLWGKDLYEYLADVYSNRARFCIMIISSSYAKKAWTNHERKNAQARAFRENREYILPVRLDDTAIPGISETIGYVDLRSSSVEEIVDMVEKKLRKSKRQATSSVVHTREMLHVNRYDIPLPKIQYLRQL